MQLVFCSERKKFFKKLFVYCQSQSFPDCFWSILWCGGFVFFIFVTDLLHIRKYILFLQIVGLQRIMQICIFQIKWDDQLATSLCKYQYMCLWSTRDVPTFESSENTCNNLFCLSPHCCISFKIAALWMWHQNGLITSHFVKYDICKWNHV